MQFVFRVLIACLLVGIILSWLAINPRTILQDSWAAVDDIGALLAGMFRWALPYILTGAVVVIPFVAVTSGLKLLRSRRNEPPKQE